MTWINGKTEGLDKAYARAVFFCRRRKLDVARLSLSPEITGARQEESPEFASMALCAALCGACVTTAGQTLAASRLTCAAAVKKACGNVAPSAGRLQACFESHFDKLTRPCGDRLARAASVARACESDARKFCGGVKRAIDVLGCMKPRLQEVSDPCKSALAKAGVKSR